MQLLKKERIKLCYLTTDTGLNKNHKFEDGNRKYVADLETGDIIQLNAVEWDILDPLRNPDTIPNR